MCCIVKTINNPIERYSSMIFWNSSSNVRSSHVERKRETTSSSLSRQLSTSRCSCLRSFQVLICLGWSGKVPLILVLQTRFFREKRKKNLAWSSRGKESCLKDKTKKNLFRITRYSISLERQAWFFPQKRKKILARSSSWTSRAVFVHERLYIRASLRHLFIWTRRQRTVSASNMTKILFPFFAGAACWSRVSRCIRWKVYLSRLNQQGMYF